jgi:regulatory protein
VDQALARAQAAKLLDDESFARQFVQSRAARGRGPGRVRRDLLALGLETTLVDRALAAAWPEEMDPEALAASLARRRAAQLGDLPRPVKLRRILAYLGRRGFSGAWVGELVRRTLATGKKG